MLYKQQLPIANMKKVFLLLISCILMSCSNNKIEKADLEKCKIGIASTKSNRYDSEINWYDEKLHHCYKMSLKYADLGTAFNYPVYDKNEVYLIPVGVFHRKDTRKVISLNLKDLKISEYPFSNIALNATSVINDKVLAINTFNDATYLESYDKSTSKSKQISYKKAHFNFLTVSDGKIFCFGYKEDPNGDKHYMWVFDEDLSLLKTGSMQSIGAVNGKSCEDKEYLYLTTHYDINDGEPSQLVKINKKSLQLEVLDLPGVIAEDIHLVGDKFIITHYDVVGRKGTYISLIKKNGEHIKSVNLHTQLDTTKVYKDTFIVANSDVIRIFDINDFKMKYETRHNIGNKYYVTTLIVRE